MSADNYVYVRQIPNTNKWTFTDESASADYPSDIPTIYSPTYNPGYNTKLEAIEAAQRYVNENIVEYGIYIETETPEIEYCPECGQEIKED